jgi:hypothetical protein
MGTGPHRGDAMARMLLPRRGDENGIRSSLREHFHEQRRITSVERGGMTTSLCELSGAFTQILIEIANANDSSSFNRRKMLNVPDTSRANAYEGAANLL